MAPPTIHKPLNEILMACFVIQWRIYRGREGRGGIGPYTSLPPSPRRIVSIWLKNIYVYIYIYLGWYIYIYISGQDIHGKNH